MKNTEPIATLLYRCVRGEASTAERIAAEEWLSRHAADSQYDRLFRELLDQTAADPDDNALQRIRSRIEELLALTPATSRRRIVRRCIQFAAAAVLLIAAVLPYILSIRPAEQTEWNEIYAAFGETRTCTLSDGTRLWLNSGSRVFYPTRFTGRERRIRIDGEVFADVTKDRRHPFVVSAPDVEVRILGTKFSLKSYAEHPNVEVALIEGSVALHAGDEVHNVDYTLTPGNMVRYNRTSGALNTYPIDTTIYGSWRGKGNLCFVNQSLGDIAADLERRFDVKIIIDSSALEAEEYYASFVNDEDLDCILRALNSGNNMRISRMHNTIIISPN